MPTSRPLHNPWTASSNRRRHGLTLAELLSATAILTLLGGAMGTLAYGVNIANDHCRGQNDAAQHARVLLERIRRHVQNSKASESFPACMVASTAVGSHSYPDRLLIWKSDGIAAGATEYPKRSNLVVYTYNPNRPIELLEITTTDTTALTSTTQTALNAVVDAMLSSPSSTKIVISDKLDIATTGLGTGTRLSELLSDTESRGLIRFRLIISPTTTQWSEYKAAARTWKNIDWPLDQYSSSTGNRRVSCLTELQMLVDETGELPPVPFFGSATRVYQLAK